MQHSLTGKAIKFALVMSAAIVSHPVVFVSDAEAQSRMCRQLNAQLASLGSRRGTSQEYRRYDRAVRDQTVQINRTKRLASRQGCDRRGSVRNRSNQCARINSTLERMQVNLRDLRNKRDRSSPNNATTSRQRDRINRELRRNRCNSDVTTQQRQASATPERKTRRRTLLEQIFGVRTYGERNNNVRLEQEAIGQFGGTFRTLCVRETDGYYFPISFSTRQEFFERDRQTCQAMCPGTNVQLYHHKMPGEDSEQMRELGTEEAYSSKPFAFAYRKELNTENRCSFAKPQLIQVTSNYSQQSNNGTLGRSESVTQVGLPVFRIDPNTAPHDFDITRANFSAEIAEEYLRNARSSVALGETVEENPDRKVRIVGPAFFPVQ